MQIEEKQPRLNKEQCTAAFCDENAVVAAGAGSGKTKVLANRFAWLLTKKGYKIDEILTLTFTKKAAAEMFNRIHSLLAEIAQNENGIAGKRARAALDDFIHARIQTLDSYSASIVKQCASRYGIRADFKIDDDRCNVIAYEEALSFLITNRNHPAIEKLYKDKRPHDIAANIFASVLSDYCYLEKERDFSLDVQKQCAIIRDEWKLLRDKVIRILDEIKDFMSEDEAYHPDVLPIIARYGNGEIIIPDIKKIQLFFDTIESCPVKLCIDKAETHPLQNSLILMLEYLAELAGINMRKGKKSGENPVKERISGIRGIFPVFSSIAVYIMQAGFIRSIMPLFTQLQKSYLSRKRTEGVLSFRDVASLARTILIKQEDIRRSEKESFKAIMIDEFQDNNELQKDILFLLAEKHDVMTKGIPAAGDLCPDKLFFVGDEKQSVYLFRGADVSVFRKLKKELNSRDFPLKINYRSSKYLIGAFNAIFGGSEFDPEGKSPLGINRGVFAPEKSAEFPSFEAAYAPLAANKNFAGKLSICILNKYDIKNNDDHGWLSADESEARFTAEKINSLLRKKDETGNPEYKPDDIALLFRTRSPQHLYEKHLRLLNIPYTCEDINDFFYGGLINDILSVLRLTAYPHDSAAYAEMLRSPFAGLSLPGLAASLTVFKNMENPQAFSEEVLPRLDESDQFKFKCGRNIYQSTLEKARTESISSLINGLWYREGYRYEAEWNPQTAVYRELFDYLFHLAVKADAANESLAAFTDNIRDLRDSKSCLSGIDIPLERQSAVRLMTIHKSKGLEFPVVFICGCGKHVMPDISGTVFLSDEAGLVISPPLPVSCAHIEGLKNNFFWEQSTAELKKKKTAELRRLLYVGMTRAEKELYLSGNIDINGNYSDEEFSLIVKYYIENKCENNENYIEGDKIINNDTFFGLLLPSITPHIDDRGLKNKKTFFTLEKITPYTEDDIKRQENANAEFPNNHKGLSLYLKTVRPFYENAGIIKTPDIMNNHITPVSLRTKTAGDDIEKNTAELKQPFVNLDFSGVHSNDIFKKIDSALEHFSGTGDDYVERFNPGSFGTIAHICVEAGLNNNEPEIPANIAGYLTPAEIKIFLKAGKELSKRFLDSPLGKIAQNAKFRESEFSFRSIVKNEAGNEIFISGTVDLFFEDSDFIHIVDFKTDNREVPGEHGAQMACYYRALSSLFAVPKKKECRAWLYYLRTGHAVDMTEKVKNFDLERKVFL
ncbi:MAG: UvrD-helicase domain-containing protein [Treponema sp.]|jgi:ATP-dependent helicase/nuclease subunit A|nr:UvrD-helicase domain-containing protein [Treponema sp.]